MDFSFNQLLKTIESQNFHNIIKKLYPEYSLQHQKLRYSDALKGFKRIFKQSENLFIFSSAGQTELGGNHTDHNGGKVLSATVTLDIISIASKRNDSKIVIYSNEYDETFEIKINNLSQIPEEKGKTQALIRGIVSRFHEKGYKIGGFNAFCTSEVKIGSGLSSSASFEVLISTILNTLYNNNKIKALELAYISQFAENIFFGKPCGLMDQLTIAYGGILTIDFNNPEYPEIEAIKVNFPQEDYNLMIVNTGESHENLTDEYSSINLEMKSVARLFGKNLLKYVTMEELVKNAQSIRKHAGDRAFLRAYHFFSENERVSKQVEALKKSNFRAFLQLVKESGASSQKWLQNSYSIKSPQKQDLNIALALSDYISGNEGASRVHGGGFAGTIQSYIKKSKITEYKKLMEDVFGKGSVIELFMRKYGAICLNNMLKPDK